MDIQERIEAFAELGEILRNSLSGKEDYRASGLQELISRQQEANPWFTPESVTYALKSIAGELTTENLVRWTNNYPDLRDISLNIRTGVIMAGNIPMVGFHDFLSVLISGNILVAKTSSKDTDLIAKIAEILYLINPAFREKIRFTEDHLQDFDIVIATGSNNSSRYFEHYFGKYTHLIRKNRNSIAIIEGNETKDELVGLGSDIFLYFGLGCRNVSKIYIPRGYDLSVLTKNWDSFSGIISHSKYANNYDFNKAVYIVNKEKFHDTGYLLLREESRISSPVAVLYWEYYDELKDLKNVTSGLKDKIQCIVGSRHIPFGQAQSPRLWDYADGVDTIDFLLKKNKAGIS